MTLQLALVPGAGHALRPYQEAAVESVLAHLRGDARSTLVVMATGLGKTEVGVEVLARVGKRTLWLAHRDELVRQAADRIERNTGRRPAIDKAEEMAPMLAPVVVASVQTISQDARLARFGGPGAFALVVVDEAHHAPAASYRKVLDYYSGAKVLGLTATPDRADELAMGQVFDEVSYTYELPDAIRDGWLCPIRCQRVLCEDVRLADVGTVAGDLNQGQLDAIMRAEAVLHQVAKPTVDLAGGRRGLLFTTSIEAAHRLAEVLNRYKPDSAMALDGTTEMGERRRIIARHQRGEFQFLCNCAVFTEGYDDPGLSLIGIARPTKSRALYAQMVGRGTRNAPGKADLLLLDFVGNSGRHHLVSAVDILGGRYDDEVRALAERKVSDTQDPMRALEEAAREIEEERKRAAARRAGVRANVRYATQDVDPFAVLGVPDPRHIDDRFGGAPASDRQLETLAKFKVPLPATCTKRQASRLLGQLFQRIDKNLCTFRMADVLGKRGYDAREMSMTTAKRVLDALANNRWQPLSRDVRERLLERQPGEDG